MKKYIFILSIIITALTNSCIHPSSYYGHRSIISTNHENRGTLNGNTNIINQFEVINNIYSSIRSHSYINMTSVNSLISFIKKEMVISYWENWTSDGGGNTIIEERNFDVSDFSIRNRYSWFNYNEENHTPHIDEDDNQTNSNIIDEETQYSTSSNEDIPSNSNCCFRFEVL
ncbi:MAG: hypothetical protein OEW67_08375 [Cyclobacteriaceae bacterium]|nr:hypothetical protein [Cyclobacteriaceae bacterium]